MAEAFAIGAGVIAVIQITERIISLCKFYIETKHDIPSDLRFILVEASMLKTVFENLKFLEDCKSGESSTVTALSGEDGPVEGCRQSIVELEKLFPSDCIQNTGQNGSKKRRVKASLTALAWPLKENKARKLLAEIKGYKTTITLALTTESSQDIKVTKTKALEMQNMLTESQRQEVYKWLQHTDPSPLHHRSRNNYEPETGNWMLRTPEWANWLDAKQRCLWIHGIPGAGKTVLISYLIEQIKQYCARSQKEKVDYVYYYFYFGHNQDEAGPFLRWLINQLCRKANLVPGSVYEMYKYGGEPDLVQLLNALEDILDKFEIIYVIVDAIDESKPRENLLKVLRNLITDPRFEKLQLLASSREYIDIEKVMEELSVSVSMANPFVEEDIRLLVRSTLRSDPKFRRWPQELLDEVERALPAGAKGMFRWAVCQIDALRRLRCERDVVKRALANLPKTLDETYDRIFLAIPDEERLFVYHALQWINYHSKLHNKGIPCEILLQAAQKSIAVRTASQSDRFYDKETFRELCGCLINITEEKSPHLIGGLRLNTPAASFAHYTVYEYLNSTRISNIFPASLTVCEENLRENCMEIALLEAQHVEQNKLQKWKYSSNNSLSWETLLMIGDFNTYCVVSALFSLCKWPIKISQQDALSTLAFDLLDPSKPNFHILCAAASQLQRANIELFHQYRWRQESFFWAFEWRWYPMDDNDAVHFLHISLMALGPGRFSTDPLALAKKFLQRKDAYNFLRTQLDFTSSASFPDDSRYNFYGSVIEVLAQLGLMDNRMINLVLEYSTRLFDPSKVLLLCIGFHNHKSCVGSCAVERLLELGADPNGTGYRVTPLQIAVYYYDFAGVSMLLKAGAEPNYTGNKDGVFWGGNTIMNRFDHHRNDFPLRICKRVALLKNYRHDEKEQIEKILLQYGSIVPHDDYDYSSHLT